MTIVDFVRIVRHNLWLLLAAVLLGLALSAVYSFLQPTLYSATASAYVVAGSSQTVGEASASMALSQAKASAYRPLVRSAKVAEGVRNTLAEKYPELFAYSVTAASFEGSNLFQVMATARTPQQAADVASAAVQATATEALRLDSMTASGASLGQSAVRLVPQGDVTLPTEPVSPNWRVNLFLGAAIGLVAGLMLALLRRSIDGRMRSQEDVDSVTGGSVLAIIPRADDIALSGKGEFPSAGPSEAVRQLRTNLRFVSVDRPPRAIVISSCVAGEGKSTVAARLAEVLAQSGQPTILVDADLRRPTQAKRLGVDGQLGLTHVLSGDASLEDALQSTEVERLMLLPAGRIPPNPSELLGSQRMRQVIDALSAHHSVIIDAPPLLPVTDAGLLSAASDGAILVIRAGSTHKEQVRQSVRLLTQVNATLLGSVLNMVQRRSMGAAVYGYGYGGYSSDYSPYASDAQEGQHGKGKRGRA